MTAIITYIQESLRGVYPETEISALTRLIMEQVCGIPPYQLLFNKDRELSESERQKITDIVKRLKQEEPIQYILGETEFYGQVFKVTPSVLIPRPETEELIELIIHDYKGQPVRLLDIGTGSGCVAVSLANHLKEATVIAADVSPEALGVARKNAHSLQAKVDFREVNILDTERVLRVFPEKLDVIVSNPPYIPDSDKAGMEKNVLDYEPGLALFVSDSDPLLFYRQIARLGRVMLEEGGCIYVEIHSALGKETTDLFITNQYKHVELIRDLSGKDRIVKAEL